MATLPRLRPQLDGLKPSLSAWLGTHPYRQRAKAVDVSMLLPQPYRYHEHGTDVLLYWYAQVRQLGEHIALWGAYLGGSPSRFVAQAVGWELYFFVPQSEMQALGVQEPLAVVWGDDGQAPNRQRLHFWVAPAYRHPRVTDVLAGAALGEFLTRYAMLWCILPSGNPLPLRAVKRWGFQQVGRLPNSEQATRGSVDGVICALTRQEFELWRGVDAYHG